MTDDGDHHRRDYSGASSIWWQRNWLLVGGRAPGHLRVAAYLLTAILIFVAAELLGAESLAAVSVVGGYLGVAALEWFWSLRYGER